MANPKVVVLCMENRSFDEFFGTRSDAIGFYDTGPNASAFQQDGPQGTSLQPFRVSTFSTTCEKLPETNHEWEAQHENWNYGAMNAWHLQYNTTPPDIVLGYYAPNDIPYISTLARNFILCDTYFCSVLGPTIPNRVMLMSGTVIPPADLGSAALLHWKLEPHTKGTGENIPVICNFTDPPPAADSKKPYMHWESFPEMLGESLNWTQFDDQTWGPNWMSWNNPAPTLYANPAIPQLPAYLAYGHGNDGDWPGTYYLDHLARFEDPAGLGTPSDTTQFKSGGPGAYYVKTAPSTTSQVMTLPTAAPPTPPDPSDPTAPADDQSAFELAASKGELPDISWLYPPAYLTQHPDYFPADGELYLARIVNAVITSPHWDKEGVVLIVTYDENDGKFDHVAPPVPMSDQLVVDGGLSQPHGHISSADTTPTKPTSGTWEPWVKGPSYNSNSPGVGPVGAGYRVPTIIVSPWTFGRHVASSVAPDKQFDHTSVIQFLEDLTGVKCLPNLPLEGETAWRREVFSSLSELIPWDQPGASRVTSTEASKALLTAYQNVDAWRLDALTRLYGPTPSDSAQEPTPRACLQDPDVEQVFPPVEQCCYLSTPKLAFTRGEVAAQSAVQNNGDTNGYTVFAGALSVVIDGFDPAEVDQGPCAPLDATGGWLDGALKHEVVVDLFRNGNELPTVAAPIELHVHQDAVADAAPTEAVPQSWSFACDVVFPNGAACFDSDALNVTAGEPVMLEALARFTSRLTFEAPAGSIELLEFSRSDGKELAGDFDGDGLDEVLVTSPWGLGILRVSGDSLTSIAMVQNGSRAGGWLLETSTNELGPIGDFDGDGQEEIFVSSAWGIGVLKLDGDELVSTALAANGTSLGGGILDTPTSEFGPVFYANGSCEILWKSALGVGSVAPVLDAFSGQLTPYGTELVGGWRLGSDDQFGPVGRFGRSSEVSQVLVTSGWGVGILELAGAQWSVVTMVANGTMLPGGWRVDTEINEFTRAGTTILEGWAYPASSGVPGEVDVILVTSPWGMGTLWLGWPAGSVLPLQDPLPGTPNEAEEIVTAWLMPNGQQLLGGWPIDTNSDSVWQPPARAGWKAQRKPWVVVSGPAGVGLLEVVLLVPPDSPAFATYTPCIALNASGSDHANLGERWRIDLANNAFGPQLAVDVTANGTPLIGLMVTSPWGLGVLTSGQTGLEPMLAEENGTRLGQWLLDTAVDDF